MSLSKKEAANHGALIVNHGAAPSDPDVELVYGEITIDGHTESVQGKSEDEVLEAIERILVARGRVKPDS